MRTRRAFPVAGSQQGYFHCISRVVDRRFVMGETEKTKFLEILRACEQFYGVRVLTYCIMSNHFHLLVEVPEPSPLTETEIAERVSALYSPNPLITKEFSVEGLPGSGLEHTSARLLDRFVSRMFNLSNFMKSLKQRFSSFYNRRHARKGTLWEERFKSVIVEGEESTLMVMGLYIDLNPVRAGLVPDPANYRFSGYGEAVAGSSRAQVGIGRLASSRAEAWDDIQARYRLLLYQMGQERPDSPKPGLLLSDVRAVEERAGSLQPLTPPSRTMKQLSESWIAGRREFTEAWLAENRWRFGRRMRAPFAAPYFLSGTP